MSICTSAMCVHVPWKPEGGIRSLGAGVIDGSEPPEVGAENSTWAPTSVPHHFSSPSFHSFAEETEALGTCISCAGVTPHALLNHDNTIDLLSSSTHPLPLPLVNTLSAACLHSLTCCCSYFPTRSQVSTVFVTSPGKPLPDCHLSPGLCPGKVLLCCGLLHCGQETATGELPASVLPFPRTTVLFPGTHCLQTVATQIWPGFITVYSKGEIPWTINLSYTEVNCSSLYTVPLPP